ncbi:MAG: histidine triad nucleotide-binding protein [Alphaproteobacteria bacterium]
MSTYEIDNIFAKILRGDLPCDKVYEDENVLAFNDIHPQAPVHVLILPKKSYASMNEFTANGSAIEMAAMLKAVGKITEKLGLKKDGYRVIINTNLHGGQEVPHLHFHILGGEALGPMRSKK